MEDTEQIDNGLNNSGNTAPPVLTTEQIPSDSNSKKKLPLALIVGVLIFFILAAGASGFFLFQKQITKPIPKPTVQKQTPTPTANADLIGTDWKTYNSDDFSFKHPSDAKVEQITEKSIINVFPEQSEEYRSSTDPKQYEKLYRLQITIEENPNRLTARQIAEKIISDAEARNDRTLDSAVKNAKNTLKDYSISGLQGVSMEFYHTEPFETKYITNDFKTYVFKMWGDEGKPSPVAQEIINQILSTFKFTDDQTLDTSNWKTYSGKTYTFRYPANYNLKTLPSGSIQLNIDNILMNITTESTTLNLSNYIDQKSWCTSISSKTGKESILSTTSSLRFEQNPCGTVGSTDIYAVNNGVAYHIQIDTQENYSTVLPVIDQLLSTFKFTK